MHWTVGAVAAMVLAGVFLMAQSDAVRAADVTIVADGQAKVAIFVPADVMAETEEEPLANCASLNPKMLRVRLRESAKDLAGVLERISGAKIEIVSGAPKAGETRIPILVGDLANARFGPPSKSYPAKQGLRYVVTPQAIGLGGESNLAASYAIYELLDRLGCRWYMPSDLGEVLPSTKTIALPEADVSTGPDTVFRSIWYADNTFQRRIRSGGLLLNAGHALEMYINKEDRDKHPEWKATVGGKPQDHRLKWSAPNLAETIADRIIAQRDADPGIPSFSLSPDDGLGYDESADDKKLDGGDFDPSMQDICLSDRLVWICNKIATRVCAKYPDTLFGMLAYVPYSRPPVREKIHPNLIPQIAPITFSRAQPMSDDGEPNNKDLRFIVEGWAKAAPRTSYYFYCFYLAEVSAPNPMIRKWGNDIPYIYAKGNCVFWQPETLANFETCFHALHMGARMAWNKNQDPMKIIDDLHAKFYGPAAKEMSAYWHFIDDTWVDTREYAGCGFGHMRRWNPDVMKKARELMDKAKAAGAGDARVAARIEMADTSLKLFEQFMKLRHDLADGRFATLTADSKSYIDGMTAAAAKYKDQFAFGVMNWTGPIGINGRYFGAFYQATYEDANKVAQNFSILTPSPIRQWRYQVDKEKKGEASNWGAADFKDGDWKTTDCMVDTWSALGLHNYMGSMWYRQTVKLPQVPAGRKVYLWIGSTDGSAKVFVNGKHVPYVDEKGTVKEAFEGYCQPASWDITSAAKVGGDNVISIFATRTTLNELGTGGLLAPAVIYSEK